MKGVGRGNLAGLQMGFEPYDAVPERVRKSRHALGLTQEQVVDRVRAIADRPDGWPRDGSWLGKIEDGTNKIAGLDDAMILARPPRGGCMHLPDGRGGWATHRVMRFTAGEPSPHVRSRVSSSSPTTTPAPRRTAARRSRRTARLPIGRRGRIRAQDRVHPRRVASARSRAAAQNPRARRTAGCQR